MRRSFVIPLLVLGLLAPIPGAAAKGGSSGKGSSGKGSSRSSHAKASSTKSATKSSSSTPKTTTKRQSTVKQPGVASARDSHGRLKRSEEAKAQFMRQTGYPHGRKGYVIDHIVPLACGGADGPSNMQWQTAAQAKAKDKIERRGCR